MNNFDSEELCLISLKQNLKNILIIPKEKQTKKIILYAIKNSNIDYMMNLNDNIKSQKTNYDKTTLKLVCNCINSVLMKDKDIINCIIDKTPMKCNFCDINSFLLR